MGKAHIWRLSPLIGLQTWRSSDVQAAVEPLLEETAGQVATTKELVLHVTVSTAVWFLSSETHSRAHSLTWTAALVLSGTGSDLT